ncbi:Bactericidal/permeability-increasing protein-like 3 [Fukomys damarensis]|uniref:Bactericidal/permeability-increasing protein-like 3 n=1 Tax=Fukomys damarensis TaxID=885580 RepID=A0A091DMG6_FUKDA|nr:Bactericidal/permeability-increasing protein-like 3 [Fukomys damarensis]
MLRILCLALCGLLTGARADPGALLRLGMDIMNHEVQRAMEESHILEKTAAEAGKKRPGVKPIKGLSNMKVKDVVTPVITLNFVPGVGIFQCVATGMTITGKSFTGANMEIIVVLNITATNRFLQDEETGLPMFKSEDCEIILVSVKTNLPSNMLPKVINKFLDSTLHKVLPGLMCPAIDAVLVYVNKRWASLNDPMPLGRMGTVKYALASTPTTTTSHIQVDFSPLVQQQTGKMIPLTSSGESLEFPEGCAEGSSQLLLSAAFLTAELALLQKSLDVKIQDKMVAEVYPKPKPLVTQIRIKKSPKVTITSGKSLLHLHGTLEMFAAQRGKRPVSLFLLEVHFNLRIWYSVHENRLQMATSLNRLLNLSQRSSAVGDVNEKELINFITDYLQEAYIPVVNDVLQVGLPLPNLLDINYDLAELDIVENALVLDLTQA